MYYKVFPQRHLHVLYAGIEWLFTDSNDAQRLQPYLWVPARREDTGVTVHDSGRISPGLTLFTSGHAQTALLMASSGEIVHEWHLPYRSIPGHRLTAAAPDNVYWRKAQLLPDGDLLAVIEAPGKPTYAYGLVRLSWDSQLRWAYLDQAHHDFDLLPNGNIVTLVHEQRVDAIPGIPKLTPPLYEDFVVTLSPRGEELERISLHRALLRSGFSIFFNLANGWNSSNKSDGNYLHPNSVDIVTERQAARLPFAEPGQVLVSLRTPGALVLLDMDSQEIVWASLGPWRYQHDPDLLDNGNLLLFDNRGTTGRDGRSQVLELDPRTLKVEWAYRGSNERPLDSQIRSAQERLPNGNTLITESHGGRILEVTREGEIVWEYINRTVETPEGRFTAVVSWAQRISPEFQGLGPLAEWARAN
jgi:hypothetical protein